MNDAPSNDDLGKQVEEGRIMSSPLPQTPMSDVSEPMKSYGEFVAWLHAKPEADHRVLMMAHIEELHRALGTGPRSRFAPAPMAEETMNDDITNHLSANGFDPTAVPRTKAFLIGWSEGDPVLVLADNFDEAIKTFCTEMADEETSEAEVCVSIDSINVVADEIISARKNY